LQKHDCATSELELHFKKIPHNVIILCIALCSTRLSLKRDLKFPEPLAKILFHLSEQEILLAMIRVAEKLPSESCMSEV